jgi:DNA-binding response OmpR family regulator
MLKGKVLVAVGDDARRQELAGRLAERGFLVLAVRDSQEAMARVLQGGVDVILLDDDIPGMDGPEFCQEIRKATVAPIVLVSMRSGESDIVLALAMGADYYFPKPPSIPALIAHLEAAARRQIVYSRGFEPETVQVGDLVLDIPAHELRRDGALIPLSSTEFRLVQSLALNAGRTVSREHLLDSLWNLKSEGVYSRTVDVHIARIRHKMGDSATTQRYIKTIPGFGYKMVAG